jgi:DNA-binding GntR family transcriptional regulator
MTETVAELSAAVPGGSKSEQAYQAVKARIIEGTYTPGYRLVLGSIAKDLGFSVVPVREAIRRLEAEGLVTFERNVGATVAGIDPTEYLYTMQTLSIVEGAATALSAPLIDSVAIARARAVNEEMRACLEHFDPVRFTRLNQDCSNTAPTRTSWTSCTAAGTGWQHCGPPPSDSSPAAPTIPWTSTRHCSS